jgi:hypothetical protein
VAPCLSWCFSGVQQGLSGLKSINGGMAQDAAKGINNMYLYNSS